MYVRHAGKEEGDCEELKHIPQGLDTTLLETAGEKALAVQTRGTVSIISLLANGAVGNSYTTPGQHPLPTLNQASLKWVLSMGWYLNAVK